MAVRNFYATTTNDNGRSVATGPAGKAEGFTIKVQQRDHGDAVTALSIYGFVRENGQLDLQVWDNAGKHLQTFTTLR